MIDPERRWHHEPSCDFVYPEAEPEFKSAYREVAERAVLVFLAADEIMSHTSDMRRDWQQISLALSLPSSSQLTERKVAESAGITKMAVSKSITKFIRLAQLRPHEVGFNGRQINDG